MFYIRDFIDCISGAISSPVVEKKTLKKHKYCRIVKKGEGRDSEKTCQEKKTTLDKSTA